MKTHYLSIGLTAVVLGLTACSTAPKSKADRDILVKESEVTVQKFKSADADLQRFFGDAAGYAVFP